MENAKQAILAFTGDVYQGMELKEWSADDFATAQKKIRILSGLYGVLRPLDLMQPYRLERGTRLKVGTKPNLYKFWDKLIANSLNEELSEGELLVNLASNEYFKAIDKKELKATVVTPVFKDFKNGEYKMIMTRTKALTALENYLSQNETQAKKDLASAKKSFISIVNVLDSSRDLAIVNRKDLSLFSVSDVIKKLEDKIPDSSLVTEAKALENLISLTEQNLHRLGFVVKESKVETFDRFVLLDRIFSFGNGKQSRSGEFLKQKYVVAFLQDIQNEELRIDQISKLNQSIAELPRTELAMEFLTKVQDLFAPNLAEMLEEKINNVF
jgi:cytoplasmic iron level regulating protein YaaA (DUF328/UPF0246 family)